MGRPELTASRLRELLHYDPETGLFTRRVAAGRWGCIPAGTTAGSLERGRGRIVVVVDGQNYLAHRLAVLWMTGAWPAEEVDHINGTPADNRWLNLRCVSHRVNAENVRHANSRNTHGFMGVKRDSRAKRKPWEAKITVNGKQIYIGTFATPEAANAAYLDAKRRLHEGCTI